MVLDVICGVEMGDMTCGAVSQASRQGCSQVALSSWWLPVGCNVISVVSRLVAYGQQDNGLQKPRAAQRPTVGTPSAAYT